MFCHCVQHTLSHILDRPTCSLKLQLLLAWLFFFITFRLQHISWDTMWVELYWWLRCCALDLVVLIVIRVDMSATQRI